MISASSSLFPAWVDTNVDVSELELWAYRNGSWMVIPYQIDNLSPGPVKILDPRDLPNSLCRGEIPGLPPNANGPCEFQYTLSGENPASGEFSDKDELVFLLGSSGSCNVSNSSWPSSEFSSKRYRIRVTDSEQSGPFSESGCVYLYRRTSGAPSSVPDLIDYDPVGDGTSHTGGCVPTSAACGAIIGSPYDIDGDNTMDYTGYRWDFLGQWTADKWFIGETTVTTGQDLVDLVKWRVDSPAETEGVWDMRNGGSGCIAFHGYIDGAVRVVRVIQGAFSGVGTTKYEFAYPGEILQRGNLRVHSIGGPVYSYADLRKSNVNGATSATIYKKGFTNAGSPFDAIDGNNPSDPTFLNEEWYQMSSSKGSFLVIPGDRRFPTALTFGGAYDDSSSKLWTDYVDAVEYDEEVGDYGAARWTVEDICDTQFFEFCYSDRPDPEFQIDPLLGVEEHLWIMLDSESATSTAGESVVAHRDRGVFSLAVKEQQKDNPGGGSVNLLCLLVLTASYGNDGGPVDLSAGFDGCSGVTGWNLYESRGLGQYRRLASLPAGQSYRVASLVLDEQQTYYASLVAFDGSEGALSSGVTVIHSDTTPPAAPQNVGASYAGGFITVTWEAPSDPDVARFKILASSSSGGPYSTADPGNDSHCQESTDITASSGTYYIVVVAVDTSGNESPVSNEVQVVVP
ncbi:MAG: hypothetical protein Q9Q40_14165 [Acidobacteriota bacterium]|nr:hypothetical protein [Acidobacteriota bacterium]